MKSKFEISMVGELRFFLGLQMKQTSDDIFLSQTKYRSIIGSFLYLTINRLDISFSVGVVHVLDIKLLLNNHILRQLRGLFGMSLGPWSLGCGTHLTSHLKLQGT